MLCVFKGPTIETIPASEGKNAVHLNAGEVQKGINSAFGAIIEHDHTVRHCQKGRLRGTAQQKIVLKWRQNRTPVLPEDEPKVRAIASPIFEALYVEEAETTVVNEQPDIANDGIWVSPNLRKQDGSPITLADFPEEFSFGNGVTCNSWVTLKDGGRVLCSWMILNLTGKASMNAARLETLRQLFEAP